MIFNCNNHNNIFIKQKKNGNEKICSENLIDFKNKQFIQNKILFMKSRLKLNVFCIFFLHFFGLSPDNISKCNYFRIGNEYIRRQ